ncbi:GntR family transcriptional regulator [Pseudooceanicola nanhaiensis]|uniref:GntR family transcriptional regulator n=1 Tax=Pseudooceanicola nanhaiensis TaxID=375761 RepID=UPI0040591ED6
MNLTVKTAMDLVRQTMPRERMSTAARIYDDLRQRILSLDLPPGTALLRAELAAKYEVSQTPLRDALQKLQQDDLVQIFPQSRTVVTLIDIPKIHEAHFLRVALETEVMRRLTREATPEIVSHGRAVIELQREIAAQGDQLRLFQELDEYFHQVLFEGVAQESLHALIRSRAGHMDRVRRLQLHSAAKIRSILDGHEEMMDAIEAKDEAAAISAVRDHLHRGPDWVEEFRASHEAYFT